MKFSHSIFYDVLNNQKEKDEGLGSFVLALSDDIIATLGEDYELDVMPPSLINIRGRRYEY
jgi:hypothetical protein